MLTILMIEDSLVQGELTQDFLGQYGIQVKWAQNGEEGLSLAETEMPDFILLDLEMPGLSGFDVCRQLKFNSATAAIPVIILTAHTELPAVRELLNLGAIDFIPKDAYSHQVLVETLRQLGTEI